MVWFGKDNWFSVASNSTNEQSEHKTISGDNHQSLLESHDESTRFLSDAISSSIYNDPLVGNDALVTSNRDKAASSTDTNQQSTRTFRYWCVTVISCISMGYIVLGLITFAMGLFWRTGSFVSLLGPLACFSVVLVASEYYHARRSRKFEQCNRKWLTKPELYKASIQWWRLFLPAIL